MQSHIILVPGFGGFDALGSLRYYHGVTEVLAASAHQGVVHYFSNMPTASVLTRAQMLQEWLCKLRERRAIGPNDELHLIGHSTGGLDLRQLLINLREKPVGDATGMPALIRQIQTVQFISTPHRGTALAHRLGGTPSRIFASRLLLRVLYEGAHGLRGVGLWGLGRGLKRGLKLLPHDRRTSNWIDAVVDTLVGCYSKAGDLESAEARGTYSELLRWLLHMASDFSAITDLDPMPSHVARPSPAHASESSIEKELAFIKNRGLGAPDTSPIRVRSIVTRASLDEKAERTLFTFLHGLTADASLRPLQKTFKIRKLQDDGKWHTLTPPENDGLVNSVSQVWPDADHSRLVPGDHADVIGHFRSSNSNKPDAFHQYDLLNAPSGFTVQRFQELWKDIVAFTVPKQERKPLRRDSAVARQHIAPVATRH